MPILPSSPGFAPAGSTASGAKPCGAADDAQRIASARADAVLVMKLTTVPSGLALVRPRPPPGGWLRRFLFGCLRRGCGPFPGWNRAAARRLAERGGVRAERRIGTARSCRQSTLREELLGLVDRD